MIPFALIDRFVPDIKVIAEIGAADGEDTRRYFAHYPGVMVLAFEPLPANVKKLLSLWIPNHRDRLRVFPVALASTAAEKTFYASGGNPPGRRNDPWPYSGSLLPPKEHRNIHPWCTFTETKVRTERFDDVIECALGNPGIDFVHIDVQGGELEALGGMGRFLDLVRGVWMEVATVELYEGQPLRNDVEAFMQSAGFRLRLDTVGGESPIAGDQLWTR